MMNQTKKHTTSKKLLALLLALIMTVSLLPMSVFAAAVDVPETEPQVTEPVEEDMQEPEVTDVEGEGDADVQNMEGGAAVYADAAQINYVEKKQSVPLKDGTFYRIVHIDCGRKYFSVDELKKIIDYAAASNYTHVELAFGNDGLRFLLDDMEVTASGVTYASENVKSAIQAGNKAFYDAGTNELTQTQMNDIISYANGKGIGIIPMFDAPGHLQAVVRAMATLGVATNKYTTPTTSGTSVNYAINFTDAASVNFVQALMQKYITYFKGQGCTMFNIAADECGFSSMNNTTYTAYAKLVNSMAAMVQNAGMTALAFNDGIYHKNLTTSVEFDTNIAVCYWDASSDKYAPAADLETEGFKIINTNNKWYYVLGKENITGSNWSQYAYTCEYAKQQMSTTNSCLGIDGDSNKTTPAGCMAAIWCDYPAYSANWTNVESYIQTLAEYNSAYFTEVKAPEEVDLPAVNDPETKVSVVVKGQEGQSAAVKVEAKDARTEGLPASAEKAVSYEITPSVENTAYTGAGKVTLPVPTEWKNNTDRVRGYIVTDGNVKTIRGTYDAASGKYTFDVPHFSEMGLILLAADSTEVTENRTINLTIGGTATDTIEGAYNGSYPTENTGIAIVEKTEVKNIPASTGDPTKVTTLVSDNKYIISDGNGHFLKRDGTSLTNVNSADEATEWTITKNASGSAWNISDGGYYLSYYSDNGWTLNLRRNANSYVSWGYDGNVFRYYNSSSNYYSYCVKYRNNAWQITQNSSGTNGAAYEKGTPTPGVDQTTITFKGVAEGTTYVTIGHVRYTINVTKENLDGVDPLPIQLWITNNTIQVDTTDATKTGSGWGGDSSLGTANFVSVSAGKAYGEQGITVVEALGLTEPLVRYEWGGTRLITAKDDKPKQELVFWTGRIHNSSDSNIQTVWGKDYSNAGDAFNYVRYYGGKWQVSADRVNWTTVTGEGSTGAYSSCTQQLAAYYMTRTEITKEVTTDVADWGKPNGGTEYTSQVGSDFVLLDYAVKYADGSRVPNKFPVTNKTLAYHCESNNAAVGTDSSGNKYRMLNNFRGVETENFEVYMVTVTMTSASAQTTVSTSEAKNGYTYDDTTEQIVWAIDETAREKSGLDDYTSISGSTTYSGCKIGGTMDIRGVEIYNKHGALITYYVRAKAAVEDKLIVNYYVEGEKTPFYFYEIGVESGTTFDHRFARTENPVGLQYNTVLNIIHQEETVNWQLETMPEIKSQYRYSEYSFVRTDFTGNEYKIVNLYYTFKTEKTFVVDFGLPLVIKPGDINANLAANGVTITGVDIGVISSYARITKDNNYNITYTLTKTIDGSDTFSIQYTGTLMNNGTLQSGQSAKYSVTIIPASTVYYEDSFASFYDAGSTTAKATFEKASTVTTAPDTMGVWYYDGAANNASPDQALEKLGSKKNVYGYDSAYDNNSTTFSMGSAKKVTVNADTYKDNNNSWPTATFTFKGTGFDIISLTSNTSGTFFVTVTNKSTGEVVRRNTIDTYYGYHQDEDGNWVAEANNPNALYQIPVMKIKGLDYAEYNVEIKVAYVSFLDHTTNSSYSFWLDAIRVYDPMGKDKDYGDDYETSPDYVELRQVLVDANSLGENGAVFIDGNNNETSVADYANYGPNHEVYLAGNQAIAFKLIANKQPTGVQLAAKQLTGTEATLTVTGAKIGKHGNTADTALKLTSGTDMYYELTDINWTQNALGLYETGSITLTNSRNNGIVALTNLKFIGGKYTSSKDEVANAASDVVLVTMMMDAATAEEAVAAVDSVLHPQEEIKTFTPERFETSWNRNSVKVGQNATLTVKTSEDVEAITVDGVTIDTYRTRTQRTGWGWNAKKVTYREFTYTITASEAGTLNCSVAAINAEGTASEAITATLTVQAAAQRPGWGGWFGNLFSRWF